ncbi:amino acid permease [Streptomyces sp. DSM 41524]|uniref:Amino acid permease n=1 Tax=Streptomyces asiaticus subsp. ignotus TaxID=3098222 RepID=A0ABU7QCK0_9ACTN|nr:amino acid permease [Streptomyces sp. DSM 41524]
METSVRANELKRDFGLWSAFALAFAFISPIIGLYTIFAPSISTAGPGFWWAIPIVLLGQLLVAVVMAEAASRWPLVGGVYQWSRRLIGARYGWFAGWVYICTLVVATATPAYVGASFLAPLVGIHDPSSAQLIVLSLVILAAATAINALNRMGLRLITVVSISAEVLGSLVIGTILLLFYRENSLSAIFDGIGDSGVTTPNMLAAMAIVGWAFVGFESAGSVAEETVDASRTAPKAIILSLLIVGLVVMYSALALILAIPEHSLGKSSDPITGTLSAQLGSGITKPLFAIVVIGFMAGTVAGQASVSRVIYALARDELLPGHRAMSRLSRRQQLPWIAVLIVTLGAVPLLLLTGTDLSVTLFNLAIGGFYVAFAFPVGGMLIARLRGQDTAGPLSLGKYGLAINVAAVAWLAFEIVNITWPRHDGASWYQNWSVTIMLVVIFTGGAVTYRFVRDVVKQLDQPSTPVPEAQAQIHPEPGKKALK